MHPVFNHPVMFAYQALANTIIINKHINLNVGTIMLLKEDIDQTVIGWTTEGPRGAAVEDAGNSNGLGWMTGEDATSLPISKSSASRRPHQTPAESSTSPLLWKTPGRLWKEALQTRVPLGVRQRARERNGISHRLLKTRGERWKRLHEALTIPTILWPLW